MGFARAIGFTSSIAAKLWAIRDGLTQCCNVSLEAVEVEIDASAMVSLVSQATHTNDELSSLIDDCRNLMKNIPRVRLKHCFSVGYFYKKYHIYFNTHLCELRKSIIP